MTPSAREASDFEYDLEKTGILGAFGYSAGMNGKNQQERRKILKRVLATPADKLPQIENKDSLSKWRATKANSCERLHLIVWYIWGRWHANYPKYEKNPESYSQLITDYESDLDWLKKEFYGNCKHYISWPFD
jgi:hypothetical protein